MKAKTLITLGAAAAWAALAVSTASPAHAVVIFVNQGGPYATCSNSSNTTAGGACGYTTSYMQNIKVVAAGCNSGGCSSDSWAFVTALYSTGRKVTSPVTTCSITIPGGYINYRVYNLGSCAC